MPTKTTDRGREYEIDGKRLTWHPLDEDDKTGNLPAVVLPLRLKLGILRSMAGASTDDVDAMFRMIDAVAPNQGDQLDAMDVNDFQEMFATWQTEYNALTGATLPE